MALPSIRLRHQIAGFEVSSEVISALTHTFRSLAESVPEEMSNEQKLDYCLQNLFYWGEASASRGCTISYSALSQRFRVPQKLLDEIRYRDNEMWIGLAVLLATLAGAVLLYSTADSPKPKFITKIIAVAVHVRRAKGAISPDSATDLFEGRYAWWAGDEIAWRETVRRAELQAIDDIPSEDDKLCVIAFQDSKPNWEEVESPTALRGYLKDAQEGSSLTKLGYYKVEGSKMLFDAGFQR